MVSPAQDRDIEQAMSRGSELLKQGNLDDAQKAFRAALNLDGGNPRVLALLGLTHFRAGEFAEARPIYEQLVDRAPSDASHRLNLGLVYLKVGDSDKAISALEASRALDPSQGRAVSYLGLAYARAGRYAEAYRSFLLAGQQELASEIELNLTATERQSVHQQLQRSGLEPAVPAPATRSKPATVPPRASEPDIELEEYTAPEPSADVEAPRITDSLQFVLPTQAAPEPSPGGGDQSMISRALEAASPASATTTSATARVAAGSEPPVPLSQLATEELVRPEDGEHPFEVTAGGTLVIRVMDRMMSRLDGVYVTGGDLAFELALRRSRGHQVEQRFDYGGSALHSVSGHGYLIALPGDRQFTAVALDDDIFYLREDLVFAFEASLRWENGNVPGLRGRLPVVQFRGDGAVVLLTAKPLVRVKLPAQGVLLVDAARLAGWIGRVIPRAVVPAKGGPMGELCVECTGEGVVLIDPAGDPGPPPAPARSAAPPPPPPAAGEATLEAAGFTLDDDDRRDQF